MSERRKRVKVSRIIAWFLIYAVSAAAIFAFVNRNLQDGAADPLSAFDRSGLTQIEDFAVPLAGSSGGVLKPEASGTSVKSGGGVTVDYSNTSEGYVMIKYTGSVKKNKVRITNSGQKTYTYDLTPSGGFTVFPFTSGNGSYKIEVFENVSGNQYATALSMSVNVKLRDSSLPFLYPNQYVNFNAKSSTVKKSDSLAQGAASDLDIVAKVYDFVTGNISYDNQKAKQVVAGSMTGYLPDVDQILSSKKGICFDYAALMTAMLRAQQIPTRMEIGYVSKNVYHAWLSTYIKDVGWVKNVIYFDGKSWKRMDPTFASSGGSGIEEFIGNGSNYSTQYIY